MHVDPYLSPYTKLKSKWMKDLNRKPDTLNLIEEKVRNSLEFIGTGDNFLNRLPLVLTLKSTTNEWDLMRLKSFCKTKDTVMRIKHHRHQQFSMKKSHLLLESLVKKTRQRGTKRKQDGKGQEQGTMAHDLKLDDVLDRNLEDGGKQHNQTALWNILHEAITNEHVVAMMKAAISETENMPLFEPKVICSKLKEVVEKGVVIPTWNISPIKKANEIKPPQFVHIHLEEDDSSDEEYQPDEEEDNEMARESLLQSDVESIALSAHGVKRFRPCLLEWLRQMRRAACVSEVQKVTTPVLRHISAEVVPMGPPPPLKPRQTRDSAFMEKLNAVDEELASSPICMGPFQPMENSLIAF
ncbi:hypothetical protein STEG23_011195 [Scotinomys teguina]